MGYSAAVEAVAEAAAEAAVSADAADAAKATDAAAKAAEVAEAAEDAEAADAAEAASSPTQLRVNIWQLPEDMTKTEFLDLLSQFGNVTRYALWKETAYYEPIMNQTVETRDIAGKMKVGWVEYALESEADLCVKRLDNHQITLEAVGRLPMVQWWLPIQAVKCKWLHDEWQACT